MPLIVGHRNPRRLDPLAILPGFADQPFPFLLYSAMPDSGKGRYSFLGADPFLRIECRGERCRILHRGGGGEVRRGDPLRVLSGMLDPFRIDPPQPLPFVGGAVGYIGYPLKWRTLGVPPPPGGAGEPPDLWFGFYDRALVFDHAGGGVRAVATGLPLSAGPDRDRKARRDLRDLEDRLERPAAPIVAPARGMGFSPGIEFSHYARMVNEAKEAIARGDIYQLNLSYRMRSPDRIEPLGAFERLVRCSPTPFCAFLDTGTHTVLSTSPERFLRWDGRRVESRPIKGTRPRGATPLEDRLMREDLLQSSKDRAENVMIVDLVRNDLGRVCRTGSVRVRRLAALETYSRVHHLVSTVEGITRPGTDCADLLGALFPGGSMTGAPKIRALQLIDALEPEPRGIYSGCLGYLSFSGEIDLSMVIRTVIGDPTGTHFHVGGAILADSVPDMEHRETLAKADAILRALGTGGSRKPIAPRTVPGPPPLREP